MRFVLRVLITAVAMLVATWVLPGIEVTAGTTLRKVATLIVVALIFGVINAVLKPIIKVLGCVFYIITLGLKYNATFSGSNGMSGNNGLDGLNGTSGSMGSIGPEQSIPGWKRFRWHRRFKWSGRMTPGATRRQYRFRLRSGRAAIPCSGRGISIREGEGVYLIDPQGGSLSVKADGGAGGSGGRGGRGGRGGSGGMGTPSGQNGRDGSDGRSGSDGPSGRGGSITVTYDPQAKPFLSLIHLSNSNGAKPVFKEEPVAPLW